MPMPLRQLNESTPLNNSDLHTVFFYTARNLFLIHPQGFRVHTPPLTLMLTHAQPDSATSSSTMLETEDAVAVTTASLRRTWSSSRPSPNDRKQLGRISTDALKFVSEKQMHHTSSNL